MNLGRRGEGDPSGDSIEAVYGRRTRQVLDDLVEFTDMAARLVSRGHASYTEDEMLRLAAEAITHRVGEAVSRLPEEFVVDHPSVEWRKIKGMRNIIAHEYARVDHEIVWNTLTLKLPEVAQQVRDLSPE